MRKLTLTKKTKHTISLVLITVISLILFGLALWFDPEELVKVVGVQNTYIILFFVSLFGGMPTGGSVTFMAFLVTAVAGGLNPIYAGLVAGISLFIGDTIVFLLAKQGRALVSGEFDERLDSLRAYVMRRPWLKNITPVLSYIYVAFLPLPNDFLILFLASISYSTRLTLIIFLLGDITFAVGISLITAFGISLI